MKAHTACERRLQEMQAEAEAAAAEIQRSVVAAKEARDAHELVSSQLTQAEMKAKMADKQCIEITSQRDALLEQSDEAEATAKDLTEKLRKANGVLTETNQDRQVEIRALQQSLSESMQASNFHHETLVEETKKHHETEATLGQVQESLSDSKTECQELKVARDSAVVLGKEANEKLVVSLSESSTLQDANRALDAEVMKLRVDFEEVPGSPL